MKNLAYWRVRLLGPAYSLGRRITIYTIALSSLIMLVISVAQLGFEYRDLRTGLDKELDGIEVFVPNLSGSVWSFDQKQIQLALDGLIRLPHIRYVSVTTAGGGKEWVSGGLPPRNALSRNFELAIVIKGRDTVIGHLAVVASLNEINQQIIDRAVIILLSNGLKSFLVALFSLFLFRHLIARRLEKFAVNLRSLSPLVFPASTQTEMQSQSRPERLDELDVVEWTLNRTENDLKRASLELGQHRDHLESLVGERTQALEMNNEALRLAQSALEESRNRYLNLYEFAPVGYLTLSADGLITEINLTGTKLLGKERKELLQKYFAALVEAKDLDRWSQLFLNVKKLTGTNRVELALQRNDGVVFQAQLDCELQKVGPGGTAVRIALTDITERKKAEIELTLHRDHLEELVRARTGELAQSRDAAEAANRAKTIFFATMSHELRTPLNGIMGMVDLVLRRATDPKQIDWLKKSKRSATHLLEIVNDVLDISRIEADRLVLEEKDFSLTTLIDEAMHMQEGAAQIKGLTLSRDTAPTLPAVLCGDAVRLKQILINFTNNAIKFSEHGTITVRVRAIEEDSHGVLLRIEVVDQGMGIGAAQQDQLFEAFTQVDAGMTRKYGGTGLGLAIAKRLALLMSGDVGVISDEGQGSTFWATIRLKRSANAVKLEPPPDAGAGAEILAKFSDRRVLLVEDEPFNQEVAQCLLEDVGLVVDVANNGKEALERAGAQGYSLILMDMQMPLMDGLEATRAIRRLSWLSVTPIIAMTANAFDTDRARCLEAGMNDCLNKPVKPEVLYGCLLRWLQKSGSPRLA